MAAPAADHPSGGWQALKKKKTMPTPPRCNCLSQSHGQSSSRGVDGGVGGIAACPDQGVHTGIRHESPPGRRASLKRTAKRETRPNGGSLSGPICSTNVTGSFLSPNAQKTATQKSETGSFGRLMRTLSKMCFPHLPSSAVLGLGALMISPVYPEHLVALVIV